jgi:hypothetical protein
MSRAGVPSDHAERCLGHVIGGVRGGEGTGIRGVGCADRAHHQPARECCGDCEG